MMLLEQCRHTVAKVRATFTWLDEAQIHVCLVTWQQKNSFCLPSPTLSTFEAVCLALYLLLSLQKKKLEARWVFLLAGLFRDTNFVLQKSTNPQSKRFDVHETCAGFCGTLDVWITVRCSAFSQSFTGWTFCKRNRKSGQWRKVDLLE